MIHERVFVPSSEGTQFPMDVYVPNASREIDAEPARPAIVICPGGGYHFCSEREAEPIALRFLSEGFNAFVIWYRVSNQSNPDKHPHEASNWYNASPDMHFPQPQQDAAAAIAYVRSHAKQYCTDPNRIAVAGFSAGGHLAASISGLWSHAELWADMGLTPEDVKPNAAVLSYPVIVADKDAHRGSFNNLSNRPGDLEAHQAFDVLNWVDEKYPPTFLWHTFTDGAVPVQNSLRLAHALADCGVLCELHVFPYGQHGLALSNALTTNPASSMIAPPECAQWPEMAARFLKSL